MRWLFQGYVGDQVGANSWGLGRRRTDVGAGFGLVWSKMLAQIVGGIVSCWLVKGSALSGLGNGLGLVANVLAFIDVGCGQGLLSGNRVG